MNITQERYSLLRLWVESFKVVNRCTGKLLWVILISVVLLALIAGVYTFAMGTSMTMLIMGKASQAAGLGILLIEVLFALGSNIYALLFFTVCCRLIADTALEEKQPLAQTFSGSVLPAIYQIATGFLFAIPMILLGIICAILARLTPVLAGVVLLAVLFTAGVRLCYSFIAIAIDGKGPIEGPLHSWKMTGGNNYLDALLMLLMVVGSVALMYLFFMAIGYGFFVMIPLHFADSFSLAHPSLIWILLALLLGVLAMFGYFVIMAFPVLVFVNRNAVLFDARDMQKDTTFIPLPELELPSIRPNPEHMQQAQSTVPAPILTEDDLNQVQELPPTAQAQAARTTPAPTAQPQPQQLHTLEGLEVSKASFNTSEKDTDSLSEHLDEVYTPQREDLVQGKEEDRMPTILFDDEMAQQLLKNQTPAPKKDDTDKKDDGPDVIKMSKF